MASHGVSPHGVSVVGFTVRQHTLGLVRNNIPIYLKVMSPTRSRYAYLLALLVHCAYAYALSNAAPDMLPAGLTSSGRYGFLTGKSLTLPADSDSTSFSRSPTPYTNLVVSTLDSVPYYPKGHVDFLDLPHGCHQLLNIANIGGFDLGSSITSMHRGCSSHDPRFYTSDRFLYEVCLHADRLLRKRKLITSFNSIYLKRRRRYYSHLDDGRDHRPSLLNALLATSCAAASVTTNVGFSPLTASLCVITRLLTIGTYAAVATLSHVQAHLLYVHHPPPRNHTLRINSLQRATNGRATSPSREEEESQSAG